MMELNYSDGDYGQRSLDEIIQDYAAEMMSSSSSSVQPYRPSSVLPYRPSSFVRNTKLGTLAALVLIPIAVACGGRAASTPATQPGTSEPSPITRQAPQPTQPADTLVPIEQPTLVPTLVPTARPTKQVPTFTPVPPTLVPASLVAPTLPAPTVTAVPSTVVPPVSAPATPVPEPNFLIDGDSLGYREGKVSVHVKNLGGLGELVAELHGHNNAGSILPLQQTRAFAAGESYRFDFDVSQLARGIDYRLEIHFTGKTSGEIKTFDVREFYVPRAADLQLVMSKPVPYDRGGKKLVVPIKNFSPDSRDKIAGNVSVELFHQGKLIGGGKSVAVKPNSSEDVVVDGISLSGGAKEITAKISYTDGFSGKEKMETFLVDVPFLPAALAFAKVPGSANKIAIGFDENNASLETRLRADLPYNFRVNLINGGEVKSESATLEFYLDAVGPSSRLPSVSVSQIEPNSSAQLTGKFKINATGRHTIRAVVPKYGITLETFVVGEPAPATVTAPHYSLVDPSSFDKKYYDAPYTKYLDAGGIPIVGAEHVSDKAFLAARDIIGGMLSARPDIRKVLANFKAEFKPSWAKSDSVYVVMQPKSGFSNAVLGLVGTNEENLLCSRDDEYKGLYSILAHEFAHMVLEAGLPSDVITAIQNAYRDAMQQGKWSNTYSAKKPFEYWAEGVQAWFDATTPRVVPGYSNGVNTREELKAYDPQLASIVSSVFGNNEWRYRCPVNAQ